MTKYNGNFENLVNNNIELAERMVISDICYAMGCMNAYEKFDNLPNGGMSLHELDDAYDEFVYINKRNKDWVLYGIHKSGDNIVLGTISKVYEKYQIATFLADLYLTFYQNYKSEVLYSGS